MDGFLFIRYKYHFSYANIKIARVFASPKGSIKPKNIIIYAGNLHIQNHIELISKLLPLETQWLDKEMGITYVITILI